MRILKKITDLSSESQSSSTSFKYMETNVFTLHNGFDDKYWIYFMPVQVIERLLSIPAKYWGQFAYPDNTGMDNVHHTDTPDQKGKSLADNDQRTVC